MLALLLIRSCLWPSLAQLGKSENQQLSEARANESRLQSELDDLASELKRALAQIQQMDGGRADAEQRMHQQLEAEKEKRVEALGQQGLKRMMNQKLAMGWSGWHEMWFENVRQRNLLKKAGARLTKPKLIASYSEWKQLWAADKLVQAAKSTDQLLAEEQAKYKIAMQELDSLRLELKHARESALTGTGREREIMRLAQEQLEKEKEKRIEALGSQGLKRMMNQKLAMGWSGWHTMWAEKVRRLNMLKAAGARLTKPKLVASYRHWRASWGAEFAKLKTMSVAQQLADEQHRHRETEMELNRLRKELSDLRKAALDGSSREAELKRLAEEELEREKLKRVEALGSQGLKRMMNQKLAMGWSAWHEMWSDVVRQRNLLKKAAARLTKPKLIQSYGHWKRDWDADQAASKFLTKEQKRERELAERVKDASDLAKQVDKLTKELAEARAAMLAGGGREAELKRLAEEELEREKLKRVEALGKQGLKRMMNQKLAMGWSAWHEMWSHKVHQRNLLKKAGARLTKPKLTQTYSHWKQDWATDKAASAKMTLAEKAAQAAAERDAINADLRKEVLKLRTELDAARTAMLDGNGREAELQRLREEELEKEKEKRVQALGQQGIKRMMNQKLAMGWSAWHEMWSHKVHQRNLLKKAGARLTKPKLIQSYSQWKKDWESELTALASMTIEEKYVTELKAREASEAENAKLRMELEDARKAMLNGSGREAELQRLAQEELEREKEKRVQALGQQGIKRMMNQKLAMGWSAWHEMWSHKVHQRNLLKKAGARLTKPKLIQSYSQWKKDWESFAAAQMSMTGEQRLAAEVFARQELEEKLAKLTAELKHTRELAMNGGGREAEIQRRLAEKLESERQERIAIVQKRAISRVFNKALTAAWTTWFDKYEARRYERGVLLQAANRLTKPKLSAAYSHWFKDFDLTLQAQAQKAAASSYESLGQQLERVEAESAKKIAALVKERDELLKRIYALDGGKAAAEMEMQRQLEAEKEKRVEALGQQGIKRMMNQKLAMGWSAWHEMWSHKVHQRNLLKKAGARLTKPKLIGSYQQWKRDWEMEMLKEAQAEKAGQLSSQSAEMDKVLVELTKVKKELAEARAAMLAGGGREAELKRLAEEELEREKLKRVEALGKQGLKRMMNQKLAMGWSAWHEMWSHKVHQRNLLKKAGARLTKPKLTQTYSHWKQDWATDKAASAKMTLAEKAAQAAAERDAINADLRKEVLKLRTELDAARTAMLDGNGREAELQRLREEELEKEKEKRVQALGQQGIKRMMNQKLAMGWSAWHEMWSHKVHQRNLLKKAGARLTKPKLIQALSHWKHDWTATLGAAAAMTVEQKYVEELKARTAAEAEVRKLRKELEDARKAMLNGDGRTAELRRLQEEELEKEKAKRVEALGQQGIKRMMNQKLAMGWSAWHEMWAHKVHQRNLLKKAGARLTKPKLIQALSHWKHDWERAMAAAQLETYASHEMNHAERRTALEKELERVHVESEKKLAVAHKERDDLLRRLTALDGGMAAAEIEMQKKLEAEKEKRVQALGQQGLKRMMNQKLAMGWSAWHDMWSHKVHQRNLLKKAAARLTKPKLIASYSLWKHGWTEFMGADAASQAAARLEAEAAKQGSLVAQVKQLTQELAEARKAMLAGRGQEAELLRLAEEELEREKEKRVQALGQQGLKRMMNQKLAMGWSAWHEMWSDVVRQRNLLKKAAARLTKPKLVASYQQWKHDFMAEVGRLSSLTQEQKLYDEATKRATAEAKVAKLEKELDDARAAMLDGRGQEAEMMRLAQEELEREKEKRVQALGQQGIKRMMNQKLAMGWSAWHEMWSHKVYQRNLLKKAALRLTKPKLIRSYGHWKHSWDAEAHAHMELTHEQLLKKATDEAAEAEQELQRVKKELEKKLTTAIQERDMLLKKLSQLDGGLAAAELEMARALEMEKEKRVQHLAQLGLKRMINGKLAMGWSAWHEMWSHKVYQRNLLKKAASRLTKPKLIQSLSHWKHDWTAHMSAANTHSKELKFKNAFDELAAAQAANAQLHKELADARAAMLDGRGQEAEMMRLAQEELEREKEKRVQHLAQLGLKRMINGKLAMGWSAWHEMWSHKVYQRNLLKKAAARLTKPKLIASYSSWRVDWERATVIARASGSAEQRLRRETLKLEDAQQELLRQRNEYEKKLEAAKRERETLLEKLSSLDGGAAEREAELRRKLEEEKERRIEQIKTMAAHRFGKQGLLRGWTQWHDLYTERVEKRRMLQSAAGRLLKPKLANAYSHWNRDWLAARQAALAASVSFQTQQLEVVLAERTAFQKENVRLNREREELLNKLSALDGGKAAAELEMQRQREEEKEKRIAHLQRMAARRILAKDLSRGMTSWIDLWFEKTRRQRLLRAASLRLTKPKLSAGYSSWKRDWELEALVGRKAAEMAKYASEDARNNTAMANVLQQRDELEERNAMLSTSLDEMRMAANRMAEELARALRGAHAERQQLEQLRKEAEAALEAERRAKEELSARQIKDAEAAAKMLRRMLDEQRSQLEGERHVIQKELLKEIDELRAKLKLAQARPPPVAVPAAGPPPLIPYDKTKTVAQSLKEYLSSKNMRVMDLFRDFDADGSGEIDRKEWIAAWAKIGADFPRQVIEAAFDEFDPNKSGSIDFEELNKFLKKSLGIAGVLGLKKATNRPRSTSPNAEASDVFGEGRGDFRSNMQIKADDFFKADEDGNSELGFDEFCNMVRMRDPEHDPTAKMSDEELKKLFVQLDLDGGGTVDLAEYVQWALQQALKESKGRVLELFNSWDDDKSGFIDVSEFHQALNGMGFGCSKADSAKVFKALDPDGSGKLDYRELNGAFRRIQRRAYALTSGGRTADKKPSPLGAKKTTPGGPKSAEKKK